MSRLSGTGGSPLARPWRVALLALGLVAVLLLHDDFGVTWDEGVHARYGELSLAYFASGGDDLRARSYVDMEWYGPTVDMALAAAYAPVPERKWRLRHLLLGLLGLAAIPALWRFGRLLRDPLVALLAPVVLFTMPRFHGHLFNNSKDVPFAVATLWFMAVLADAFSRREMSWRHVLGVGAALGVACSIRPGGFPLLAGFLLLAAALAAWRGGRKRRGVLLGIAAVGWGVMVLPWPAAHPDPLAHPVAAMVVARQFPNVYPVLFEGAYLASDALPWRYLPTYLFITTPPAVMLLAALGLVAVARRTWRRPRSRASGVGMLLAAWLLLPLAAVVVLRPAVYDGIRQFLFLLPALALLAGIGAARALRWLRRRVPAPVAWGGVLLVLLAPLLPAAGLHPYQTSYFNALAGGVDGAAGRYDLDYWVSSYGEALACLREESERRGAWPDSLLVAGTDFVLPAVRARLPAHVDVGFLADEWPGWPGGRGGVLPPVPPPPGAGPSSYRGYDHYLATTRYEADAYFPEAPVVCRVERGGVTLSLVKRLDPGSLGGSTAPRRRPDAPAAPPP